jgi:hypothetical protein
MRSAAAQHLLIPTAFLQLLTAKLGHGHSHPFFSDQPIILVVFIMLEKQS